MTPNNKKSFKSDMQTRSLQLLTPSAEQQKRIDSAYYVEGYAALYDPYVFYEDEDGPIYEQFERGCFNGTDMSDIILQLNHQGTVYARLSNGSLIVEPDEKGLFVAADLSRTSGARERYEEISAGMITKMSWGFLMGDCEYIPETRTLLHHSVKKIFDVSVVSIPANDNTSINARSFADGLISARARREAELEDRRRRLRLKIQLQEAIENGKN